MSDNQTPSVELATEAIALAKRVAKDLDRLGYLIFLLDHRATKRVGGALGVSIKGAPAPLHGPLYEYDEFAADPPLRAELEDEMARVVGMSDLLNTFYVQFFFNLEFAEDNAMRNDSEHYFIKKRVVQFFNSHMREHNVAIEHPETGEPCTLVAVNSRDGKGRYTLENKTTKKRTGSFNSITEALPLTLHNWRYYVRKIESEFRNNIV